MGLFGFVREVVDVLPILPLGHPLIVVPSAISATDAMRVANEEGTNVVLHTEVHDLAGGLVPHILNTALTSSARFVLGALHLLPALRVLCTSGLFLRQFAKVLMALSFERTNTTP